MSVKSAWLLLLCLIANSAWAFPPAPGFVVFGLVRDSYGEVVDGPNTFIIFKSGDVEIARSSINAGPGSTENYRVLLPSDMDGGSDGYKEGVLDAALPFTVQVAIGSRLFDPIESSAGLDVPDEPGSALRFDFSLGTDTDADGLPDEWELQQLLNAGIEPGSENYNLDQFRGDGDFDGDGLTDRQEYLAGTFAYLNIETLDFQVLTLDAEKRLRVQFLAVLGQSYSFESSSDLVSWQPIQVSIMDGDVVLQADVNMFQATDTRILSIAIQTEDSESQEYFRLRIYRNF